jgi:hypothetical protein
MKKILHHWLLLMVMQIKAGKITNVIAFLDGIKFDDILKHIPLQ